MKEFLIYNNKLKSVDHGIDDDGKSLPPTTHSLLSSTAESNDVKNVDAKIKLKENRFHNEPRNKKGGTEGSFDIRSDGLELEARINKLRKEIDDLKALTSPSLCLCKKPLPTGPNFSMEKPKDTIVEERKERMVSLTSNAEPTLRTAHFLKPSITSIGENTPKHPSASNYFLPSTFEPKNIAFHGWRSPQKKWKEWVDKMVALHESTWKKAGIYEAVLSSVYQIRRNNDLLLGLAEKCPLETEELKGVERKLMEIRKELGRSKAKKTDHSYPLNGISNHLFPVAVRLARVPRLTRWHDVNSSILGNVRLALDCEGGFQWRPYTTAVRSLCYKIYGDEEKWVCVDVELNEEFKSFGRCLNACELVGVGCIEQICPHRVAMRFGLDQDLSGLLERSE
ncbi:unnamed protein product [Dovyalis caffra]|uniref:Aminotransferase-like plant mobile domain-containing protein n=1 Tax=Dovyalis caffra TaxID=77055 RepID=A0AAV1RQ64_9ROSI|nr:unnamed protein product [Dovyalis caffra]